MHSFPAESVKAEHLHHETQLPINHVLFLIYAAVHSSVELIKWTFRILARIACFAVNFECEAQSWKCFSPRMFSHTVQNLSFWVKSNIV